MRKELYKALVERLKQLIVVEGEIAFVSKEKLQAMEDAGQTPEEVIKHFGLWNNQIDRITSIEALALPAVLIEFGMVKWRHQGGGLQDADLIIGLHVVTEFITEGYDNDLFYLDLLDKINRCLHGFSGEHFQSMQRIESNPCHDHLELLDDTEVFKCMATDDSAVQKTIKIAGTKPDITIQKV
ncbi:hypothetical protein EZS27_021527 [termite gut metagenome]|uniref:Uncharacterized protein n=1 Tax=termite gut metagenome TaxID=433724 RepID=A0A5J4R7P7_9ZZZZ